MLFLKREEKNISILKLNWFISYFKRNDYRTINLRSDLFISTYNYIDLNELVLVKSLNHRKQVQCLNHTLLCYNFNIRILGFSFLLQLNYVLVPSLLMLFITKQFNRFYFTVTLKLVKYSLILSNLNDLIFLVFLINKFILRLHNNYT